LARFVRLAVRVADPVAIPVTGTVTLVAPVAKFIVPGTVATLALLLLSVTVSTAGAGKDKFSCRFCVPVPLIVRLGGEKLMVAVGPGAGLVTCTCPLAVGKPKADAVMLADPAPTPVTVIATRVLVAPSGMKMVLGNAVAIEELLLASVMDTPPVGAAAPNVTGKLTELATGTVTPTGTTIPPAAAWVTVTEAVALPRPVALAVMITDPAATLVTGTDTLVVPAAKVAVGGTVATAGLLALRLTVNAAAVGAERFSVRFCVRSPLIVTLGCEKLIVVLVGGPPPLTCACTLAVV
jgi:hypothetical protein